MLIDDDIEHGKNVGGESFNLLKQIPPAFIEERPLTNMDGDTGEGAEVRVYRSMYVFLTPRTPLPVVYFPPSASPSFCTSAASACACVIVRYRRYGIW